MKPIRPIRPVEDDEDDDRPRKRQRPFDHAIIFALIRVVGWAMLGLVLLVAWWDATAKHGMTDNVLLHCSLWARTAAFFVALYVAGRAAGGVLRSVERIVDSVRGTRRD